MGARRDKCFGDSIADCTLVRQANQALVTAVARHVLCAPHGITLD